jgi:hypothetical protein
MTFTVQRFILQAWAQRLPVPAAPSSRKTGARNAF